jgi:hypothetical protein
VSFDLILAFSVFTHTDRSEMLELVGALRRMLTRTGVLAFTFFDPHYDASQSDPSVPSNTSALQMHFVSGSGDKDVEQAQWYLLIDQHLYVEPGDDLGHQTRVGKPLESYTSYFTTEYMKSLFPDARVLPPVSREWQHCCVLKKTPECE